MFNQVDIDDLLRDPSIDPELKRKLQLIIDVRQFATKELDLPDNGSYQHYSQLKSDYVVWNVIAAPEFSLQPETWCFLIVGCLPYRGYYDKDDALQFAQNLKQQGLDVHVGGATAYSTLGWFKDPVLSSMLRRSDNDIARVIFHELAHQKFYFTGDTEFNEAFADSVALIGIEQWLATQQRGEEIDAYRNESHRENEFVNLVIKYKEILSTLYASQLSESNKRQDKKQVLADMVDEYHDIRQQWDNQDDYSSWFSGDLSNAKLTSVLTYRQLEPFFRKIYIASGNDLNRFYSVIASYEKCSVETRRQSLMNNHPANPCILE